MIRRLSIAQLYPYALAEGEGVGTAYEYFAKRLVLSRWLGANYTPERIIITGLPQKYGSSLDFALLAHEYGAELTVIDDRKEALAKFVNSLDEAQSEGYLKGLSWQALTADNLMSSALGNGGYDLALCSEVIQRFGAPDQRAYLTALGQSATRASLFCPNADNRAHTDLSGLAGLTIETLRGLVGERSARTGFIDMPPFPPGITRTDEQREQATTGRLEAAAMAGLGLYARLERYLPGGIRRRQSHIVFALLDPS